MRFIVLLLSFQISVIAFIAHVSAQHADPTPKPHARMVVLLKEQAETRKLFFDEEARSKSQFKATQVKEIQELLERHRAARVEFSKSTHAAEERTSFYRGQRDEMAKLKAKQKGELRAFLKDLKDKLRSFHRDQKAQRRELESELRRPD